MPRPPNHSKELLYLIKCYVLYYNTPYVFRGAFMWALICLCKGVGGLGLSDENKQTPGKYSFDSICLFGSRGIYYQRHIEVVYGSVYGTPSKKRRRAS